MSQVNVNFSPSNIILDRQKQNKHLQWMSSRKIMSIIQPNKEIKNEKTEENFNYIKLLKNEKQIFPLFRFVGNLKLLFFHILIFILKEFFFIYLHLRLGLHKSVAVIALSQT